MEVKRKTKETFCLKEQFIYATIQVWTISEQNVKKVQGGYLYEFEFHKF